MWISSIFIMRIYNRRLIRLLLVVGSLALVACGDNTLAALTETHSDQANSTEDAAATKSSSKAKDTPEVRNMLAAFAKQAHRIELNGCEMLYNGKPFELGMTLEQLQAVFGKQDFISDKHHTWKSAGVVFVMHAVDENSSKVAKNFSVIFNSPLRESYERYKNDENYLAENKKRYNDQPYLLYTKQDIVLFQGVPIDRKQAFGDFIKTSSFQLDDFYIDNYAYQVTYPCSEGSYHQRYFLFAKALWDYKGVGHLQIKTEPSENNRNPIERIFIKPIKNIDSKQ